ncbi:uncharacterized protein AB675_1490 [Cyphellophora attinorum]|uniref:Arrestin C-terminal-like domain-containing protein n=1 Tax=Cyphellophora attinorum TaxID=1664694 RepID=A0A0N1H0B9_9EURO|nr:uncharacterized protein AB675_1490 [Phialophora attinorum]KPI37250.1 hypothetical protein AB675_1490 [Phialophora attinorum]
MSIFPSQVSSSKPSLVHVPKWKLPPAPSQPQIRRVPVRSRSISPVRHFVNLSAQSSDEARPAPNHTVIRAAPHFNTLTESTIKHSRIGLDVRLPSLLFVGGGTVEGHVTLTVDAGAQDSRKETKPITISRLTVDVIGTEEVSLRRFWPFLTLGHELFDINHPPPSSIVNGRSSHYNSELGWFLTSGTAKIPFCVNLPLNPGPPPYKSKSGVIRYMLSVTAQVKVGEQKKGHIVRKSQDISVLKVYDPLKALAGLPQPLVATDSLTVTQSPEVQTLTVSAGLHRKTWVSGSDAFIDVQISNRSAREIKRFEVQLQRTTMWYNYAAPAYGPQSEKYVGSRTPKKTDIEICSTWSMVSSKGRAGIRPFHSEVRTCPLAIPRNSVSVDTGRWFEVHYFINVVVPVGWSKSCSVQLPITLIPYNSLDIPPNQLASVAASIEAKVEAKRQRTLPFPSKPYQPYRPGQSFDAPRRRSLDQARSEVGVRSNNGSFTTHELATSPCKVPSTPVSRAGPTLPRLQVSTSGIGFSDSEFELPADSSKKVMLSEQERKMINQARELKMRREYSLKYRKAVRTA